MDISDVVDEGDRGATSELELDGLVGGATSELELDGLVGGATSEFVLDGLVGGATSEFVLDGLVGGATSINGGRTSSRMSDINVSDVEVSSPVFLKFWQRRFKGPDL